MLKGVERDGPLLSFALVTRDAAAKAALRRLAFWAGKVAEQDGAWGSRYADRSPFRTNTVHLDMTGVHTGWAVFAGPVPETEVGTDASSFALSLCCLDDEDLRRHVMSYECEDHSLAGTAVSDAACSGNAKVSCTPSAEAVKLMEVPALHLPDGEYAVHLHARCLETATAAFRIVCGGFTGTWVGCTAPDAWEELLLGVPEVSSPDTGLELWVKDGENANAVELDLVQVRAENYTGQYRMRADYHAAG